jgi:hypothetical protein
MFNNIRTKLARIDWPAVYPYLFIGVFLLFAFVGAKLCFNSYVEDTLATAARNQAAYATEMARRETIPVEEMTEFMTYSLNFDLDEGQHFGGVQRVARVTVPIYKYYDKETNIYTCRVPDVHVEYIEAHLAKYETIFYQVVNNLEIMFPGDGALPKPFHIVGTDPKLRLLYQTFDCDKAPTMQEETIKYIFTHSGTSDPTQYETMVVNGDGVLHVTYYAPTTETGRSSLQTYVSKDDIRSAVFAPFLEEQPYVQNTPHIVSPDISAALDSPSVLLNLLNQIGSRNDSEKVAELLLFPRDSRSLEIEHELTSVLYGNIDLLAGHKGVPVMVSISGYQDQYSVVKGYLQAGGGGANGSLDAGFGGGILKLWSIALGGAAGDATAEYNQDPINVDGGFSSVQINSMKIFIYLDRPESIVTP